MMPELKDLYLFLSLSAWKKYFHSLKYDCFILKINNEPEVMGFFFFF